MYGLKSLVLCAVMLPCSFAANASYQLNCRLTGVIQNQPVTLSEPISTADTTKTHKITMFNFKVASAQAVGRADADCQATYANHVIAVRLLNLTKPTRQTLYKNKSMRLLYNVFNDRGHPTNIETFSLTK